MVSVSASNLTIVAILFVVARTSRSETLGYFRKKTTRYFFLIYFLNYEKFVLDSISIAKFDIPFQNQFLLMVNKN